MRILSVLAFATLLTSCVSSGKFKRAGLDYRARIENLDEQVQRQQDSLLSLSYQLERSRGGNDALLATQDKLQDRLAAQADKIDALSGNLSNTSAKLSGELARARADIQAAKAARDSLRMTQEKLIKDYEAGLNQAASALDLALEDTVSMEDYRITVSSGEVRMSVQEDILFSPRSVTRLTDLAPVVLRAVIDALEADPLLKLTVVGHTDNKPNPRRGANNWEYASLRATRLAQELADTYYLSPNRVVAGSHGEFGPISSNSTDEGRATNRRIDFILTNSVGNLLRELNKL